ncbi:KPN_02809 family neutral zinc metallopeptidase [Facklamia sp. P12945]|uniref:KPN_02809 family neutral zinc metallopeptidase n=1 Tax=unclassified Facklamia TaxID=2622293 RepID=UPI003D1715E8
MRWEDLRRSKNVEDRRSQGGSSFGGGMGSGRSGGMSGNLLMMLLMSKGKFKWILIGILLISFFTGGSSLLGGGQPTNRNYGDSGVVFEDASEKSDSNNQITDEEGEFLSVVLANTEDFWTEKFAEYDLTYKRPKLVLYTEGTNTGGCGFGQSSAGPFYCPGDQAIYIDVSFYRELANKYGAPGDFAMAYVLAHEVGHHVQQQLGTMDDYQKLAQQNPGVKNELTVRLELQADYYAGAWARYADEQGILDEGDIEEALQAAFSVGDDTLQKETMGYVVPDSFTHGTSKQRQEWFARGYKYAGDFQEADTFNGDI